MPWWNGAASSSDQIGADYGMCRQYYDYYYGYYDDYWYFASNGAHICLEATPPHGTIGPKGLILLLSLWTVALYSLGHMLEKFNLDICRVLAPLRQYLQVWGHDLLRLGRVARFVMAELLMILSHHCICPCVRRRTRRWAMAVRPYVVNTVEDGEVFVHSPPTNRAPRSTPRSTAARSLAEIQHQVAGGTVMMATRTKRSRFPAHRRRCLLTVYNPQTAGECLFAT
eukprot:2846092-Amphidinium_carterae.1